MPSSTKDKPAATHIIETWWQRLGAPGLVCLAVGKNPPRSCFFRQETVDVEAFIRAHDGEHLFFCPHTFAPLQAGAAALVKNHGNLLGRIKECSIPCAALWADLDAVDPNKLGALEPTIAWETSPKRYQGLWLTDGVVEIGLNKRLTYHLGADKGGWCFTKLLRLPGSRNQKYQPPPLALVLWDDGPEHRVDELERLLPPLVVNTAHRGRERVFTPRPARAPTLTSQQLCEQYGLCRNLRRELLHGRQIGSERRHRMHWKLACGLHEAGVSAEDAFVLLRETAWCKHSSDEPVWALIEKVWSR